jgi:uncharacterized protein (TIGR04222 family)
MNPLDLKGPEFLSLYVVLLSGGFLVALTLRYLLRVPAGQALRLDRRVDPYEVAALGGPDALIEAAVAALFHRSALRIEGRRIATANELSSDAAPIERSVFECAATGNTTREDLRRALSPDIKHFQRRLSRQGLVVDEAQAQWARLLPSLVYGSVLLLGLAKILVGMSRDKPVTLLVILVGLGCLGLLPLARRPWRSRLGDFTLNALRDEHQPLRTTAMAGESSQSLSGRDLALAVGLFGPAMLIPMGYADLRQLLQPTSTGGAGDGDSGGDCSSGDCSSGCSSGGCGGGGCGGCGGGD